MKSSALLLVMLTAVTAAGCGKPAAPPAATAPVATPVMAEEAKISLNLIDEHGTGASVGSIQFSDSSEGLVITPDLNGLPPGPHGFHVHMNPDCSAADKDGTMTAGAAAGEHYDPDTTGKHAGPEGMGHKGDLPHLMVTPDGKATTKLIAPRLKVADLKNRSVMIHADNDDYAAAPGGARIACGVLR